MNKYYLPLNILSKNDFVEHKRSPRAWFVRIGCRNEKLQDSQVRADTKAIKAVTSKLSLLLFLFISWSPIPSDFPFIRTTICKSVNKFSKFLSISFAKSKTIWNNFAYNNCYEYNNLIIIPWVPRNSVSCLLQFGHNLWRDLKYFLSQNLTDQMQYHSMLWDF